MSDLDSTEGSTLDGDDHGRQRVCFVLQVRPDRLDEYVEAHASVWPEMHHALRASGWHNYSLFFRPDGLVVGYLETADFDAALAAMATHEVNDRWQQAMAPFFVADGTHPDRQMKRLTEYFHLA